MTITRYRTGSGTTVRTDVERWGASSPRPRSSRGSGGRSAAFDTSAETGLPSERFFSRARACSRYSIENHDADEHDTEDLACDIIMEIRNAAFYEKGNDRRYPHHYVTHEELYGAHGEIFTLDCPYEIASRKDFETFRIVGEHKVRANPFTHAGFRKLMAGIRVGDAADDLVPLYDTLGRDFTPILDKRRVGVGKPQKKVGYVYDTQTGYLTRKVNVIYDSYRTVCTAPWAERLGIDFKD